MPLDLESLKTERKALEEALREIESDQRKLEASQKKLRQKEIQTKRTLEALNILIDVQEPPEAEPKS